MCLGHVIGHRLSGAHVGALRWAGTRGICDRRAVAFDRAEHIFARALATESTVTRSSSLATFWLETDGQVTQRCGVVARGRRRGTRMRRAIAATRRSVGEECLALGSLWAPCAIKVS